VLLRRYVVDTLFLFLFTAVQNKIRKKHKQIETTNACNTSFNFYLNFLHVAFSERFLFYCLPIYPSGVTSIHSLDIELLSGAVLEVSFVLLSDSIALA